MINLFQPRITRSLFEHLTLAFVNEGYTLNARSYIDGTNDPQYAAHKQLIVDNKGFFVTLYNEASPQGRGTITPPAIYIKVERILPGDIGTNIAVFNPTEGNPSIYDKTIYKHPLSDIQVSITYTSSNVMQDRVMGAIIHGVIGSRNYIPYYYSLDDVDTPLLNPTLSNSFLMEQTNYFDVEEDGAQGMIKRIYDYTIKDITTEFLNNTTVSAIKTITVDNRFAEPPGNTTQDSVVISKQY